MKKYVKKCEYCEKIFVTGSTKKKYCTNECRTKAVREKIDSKGQICWNCKKATGGCFWSHELKPVQGWVADPITTKDVEGDIRTYNIKFCPEFIKG